MKSIKKFESFSPKALALAVLSVATLASCSKDEISQDMAQHSTEQQAPISQGKSTGNYIVVLKDGSEIAGQKHGLSYGTQLEKVKGMALSLLKDNGIPSVEINDDNNIGNGFTAKLSAEQISSLKKDTRVAYIEEDRLIQPSLSGDVASSTISTVQKTSWGVTKVGGIGNGTGKTAWIIDSGIDPAHKDLNVDKTRSKSFLTSTQGSDYKSYADAFGHGTQVAGIIGAKNNTYGTVGVAANASLVSLRVMDRNGSAYLSKIVAALNWVATYGKAGDVVNLSIGTAPSTTLDAAVKKVASKGIFVAIAAGNSAKDASLYSPSRVNATNVFTVSNMDAYGKFNSTSNYGATTVDYAAPGTSIYTTAKGGGYAIVGGTSFSAPHMAGVLLMTGGRPKYSGYVTGDKDSKADKMVTK